MTGIAPLALTMGDPAGIGPEITLAAWAARRTGYPFVLLGDPVLYPGAQIVGSAAEAVDVFPHALPVLPIALARTVIPGQPDSANAQAVITAIERATRLTQAGETAAVVTNPISKATLYGAGFAYPGHTEYLAALTDTPLPVMMLAAPALRVVPITIHVSLQRALDTLTTAMIIATCRITNAALRRDFGIARPRLAIAGLNPHAGENGAMGDEEIRIIRPAMDVLAAEGIEMSGPWPPDTMFTARARPTYDVAMCMYHDQALIPLKTLDMDGGVNVTLGLPIIRTSPDHGTAFGIAGQGLASPASLLAALDLAAELAARKEKPAC
jgi:4-hydroxythreonine-4-phosphate dehydrogenase